MPIQSLVNQYMGINAHLQSYYQAKGGWPAFHDNHITHLQESLGEMLRPFGYLVDNATSLQVREIDPDRPDDPPISYVEKSDVGIREHHSRASSLDTFRTPNLEDGTLVLSIVEAMGLIETDLLRALAIREVDVQDGRLGRTVAWLEVLSPSNKPGGQDWADYAGKRLSLIKAGITLIELDYLHKQPPVIAGVPSYRANPRRGIDADPTAKPYLIAVTDPHPTLFSGRTSVYAFEVDERVPLVHIPLARHEMYTFDFGAVYNRTFGLDANALLVDYERLPEEFATYNARDQSRIQRRMDVVTRHEHRLKEGPFSIETRELDIYGDIDRE